MADFQRGGAYDFDIAGELLAADAVTCACDVGDAHLRHQGLKGGRGSPA